MRVYRRFNGSGDRGARKGVKVSKDMEGERAGMRRWIVFVLVGVLAESGEEGRRWGGRKGVFVKRRRWWRGWSGSCGGRRLLSAL
jgi:hypothetical protein